MNKTNILEFLEVTACRMPEKRAFFDGESSVSFDELQRRAKSVGSFLASRNITRQAVIVLMDKHPDTVCALFGTLYAGCFYICLDSSMPTERLLTILEKTRAAAVIYDEKNASAVIALVGRADIFPYRDIISTGLVIDEALLSKIRQRSIDTDLAYIVFTSGSTGVPKGVCATHRSVIDYTDALLDALPFDGDTVFGNQAPLSYDAPLKEIMPALALGASVCLIPMELFKFPIKLCEFIVNNGINTLCWAASALTIVYSLGALDDARLDSIQLVCHGSEVFPIEAYKGWRSACPYATFVNLYGPTEATGMSSYWIANRELSREEPIPIGKAFKNTEIFLIGDDGKFCGDGEVGEIYIRGSCLALGYYNDTELTHSSFVQNPLNRFYAETVFKTGDLAKRNSYGELVYLGRRDGQIKLMGHRIELGEIERCAHIYCHASFATAIFDEGKSRILLAYIGDFSPAQMQRLLSLRLPKYMMPRVCVRIDHIPLLPNGKQDRASILELMGLVEDDKNDN